MTFYVWEDGGGVFCLIFCLSFPVAWVWAGLMLGDGSGGEFVWTFGIVWKLQRLGLEPSASLVPL
jgi:hypothetical protein